MQHLNLADSKLSIHLEHKHHSMPLSENKLMHSARPSSLLTSGSMLTDRYNKEPQRLDWTVPKLTDEHKRLYFACNKYRKERARTHFDFLAANYEGMYLRMGYPDPKFVASYCAEFAKKRKWTPADAKVLDLACGTGLVGKHLAEEGFKNIYGLDISANMLEEASAKGLYSELDEHALGNPDDLPEKFKNHFDFVTCAGLVNNNHMDYLLFEEMLLCCKQGGFAVFAARFSYMGKYWYGDVIHEMERSMRWKLLASEAFFKYDKLEEVSIGRFSKTPCKVFVFQKVQDDIKTHVDRINLKLKHFLMSKQMLKAQMQRALQGKMKTKIENAI